MPSRRKLQLKLMQLQKIKHALSDLPSIILPFFQTYRFSGSVVLGYAMYRGKMVEPCPIVQGYFTFGHHKDSRALSLSAFSPWPRRWAGFWAWVNDKDLILNCYWEKIYL